MEGYKKKLRIVNIGKINVFAIVLFFVTAIIGYAINLLYTDTTYLVTGSIAGDIGLAVGLVIIGIVLHEGLHALTAIILCGYQKGDIKFGVKLKEGIFYCHYKKEIIGWKYCIMLIIPIIITGIIPFIITILLGGLINIAVFSLLIAGGAGDIAMLCVVIKNKDTKRLLLDHYNFTAYYAFYSADNLPPDFSETTEEEDNALLSSPQAKDAGKIGITIALIVVFIAITVLTLFIIGLFMEIV